MGQSACCSKKGNDPTKLEEYNSMSYNKKKVFKKKKLNKSGYSTYDNDNSMDSEYVPYDTIHKSSETMTMTK